MMDLEKLKRYKYEVENEIKTNILPFWANKTLDKENGGFYGMVLNDLTVDPSAPKGSVLCSRILWTFSRAFTAFGDRFYIDLANRAYKYLIDYFIDGRFGGVYWKTDHRGKPVEIKKQVYAQAFTVYALAEFYLASGSTEALALAKDIYYKIEKFGFEKEYGGYYDACERDWSPAEDTRLSERDMNAPKTMNTNLHILEAYTNLLRSWDEKELRDQLKNLLIVIAKHIIDPSSFHLKLFFDEKWRVLSDTVSYGHDIEGSWLLVEAAEILGEESVLKNIENTSVRMAEAVYREGIAPDGGLWYEGDKKGVTNFNSDWWPQAEAMVGFLNAYQLSRKEEFLKASLNSWEFIKDFIIDRIHGGWFWSVDKYRSVNNKLEKVGIWKCPYHNARACIEVSERLNKIINDQDFKIKTGSKEVNKYEQADDPGPRIT
jgi:mannobiose 2-epimerase